MVLVFAGLVFVQMLLGAFVAGLKAGNDYNTWPLMHGRFIPQGLGAMSPWWENLFENATTVQFNHRMVAYLLWIVAMLHAVDAIRSRVGGSALNGALALACLMTLQAGIGIVTLVLVAVMCFVLMRAVLRPQAARG